MKSTLEALNWRYATKQFDPNRTLTGEQLHLLKESLRLAPSSFGLQPWHFVIVENQQLKEQLVGASWGQTQVREASHVFVICRKMDITVEDVDAFVADTAAARGQSVEELQGFRGVMVNFIQRMSHEQKIDWMSRQIYIALSSLMTVAAYEGIDACPMEGILPDQYSKILDLDQLGIVPILACPVGFRSDADKYAGAPKVRHTESAVFTSMA
ncbi:MAG: NAD(P)H-dependent oxidoreductase [Verrucomicrobiota bacterium]